VQALRARECLWTLEGPQALTGGGAASHFTQVSLPIEKMVQTASSEMTHLPST
jgi:hypothetical protein